MSLDRFPFARAGRALVAGLALAAVEPVLAQCISFSDDVGFDAGGAAADLTLADLDGDGRTDAAVALGSGAVAVLLNDGKGGFTAPVTFAASDEGLTQITSADLDGDDDVDLAVIGFDSELLLLFNDGGGRFGPPVATGQPGFTFGPFLEAADMDGDGDVDIVLNIPSVVLLNDGDGGFANAVAYSGSPVGAVQALGDLDGDELPDIVTTEFNAGVKISFNQGGGRFVAGPTLPAGPSVVFARIVDLDGDGRNDIVVANSVGGFGDPPGATGRVTVLMNEGEGGFAAPASFDVGDNPQRLAAADLNGDGHVDLVAANGQSHTLSILAGAGDGTFDPDVMFGNDPGPLAVADVDGDGRGDLVFVAGGLTVLFNTTAPPPVSGDLNDDGVVDVEDLIILITNWS